MRQLVLGYQHSHHNTMHSMQLSFNHLLGGTMQLVLTSQRCSKFHSHQVQVQGLDRQVQVQVPKYSLQVQVKYAWIFYCFVD